MNICLSRARSSYQDSSAELTTLEIPLLAAENLSIYFSYMYACNYMLIFYLFYDGGAVAWWLTPRTPDPEVGGSSPTRVAVLCP